MNGYGLSFLLKFNIIVQKKKLLFLQIIVFGLSFGPLQNHKILNHKVQLLFI